MNDVMCCLHYMVIHIAIVILSVAIASHTWSEHASEVDIDHALCVTTQL